MSLSDKFAGAVAGARHPVDVPLGEGKITLFVRELGYLELQEVYAQARINGQSALGLLVASAVEDVDGNRFTYPEAMALRREVAAPLFSEVARLQRIGDESPKS
jgi:hypothetical protein